MKFLLLLAFLFLTGGAYAQQLNITGIAPAFMNGDTLSLEIHHPKAKSDDKPLWTVINNGNFYFRLNQQGAERYALRYHKHTVILFLDSENTRVELKDSLMTHIVVKGNTTQQDYEAFNKIMSCDTDIHAFYKSRLIYYKSLEGKRGKDTLAKIKLQVDSLTRIYKKRTVDHTVSWVKSHPTSQINGYVLIFYTAGNLNISGHLPDNELRELFNSLPDIAKQNSWGRELADHINGLLVGSTAPDFTENDPNGRAIRLSDFKGKYILLDFGPPGAGPAVLKIQMSHYATENLKVIILTC